MPEGLELVSENWEEQIEQEKEQIVEEIAVTASLKCPAIGSVYCPKIDRMLGQGESYDSSP